MGELIAALTQVKDALSILTPPEIKGLLKLWEELEILLG